MFRIVNNPEIVKGQTCTEPTNMEPYPSIHQIHFSQILNKLFTAFTAFHYLIDVDMIMIIMKASDIYCILLFTLPNQFPAGPTKIEKKLTNHRITLFCKN